MDVECSNSHRFLCLHLFEFPHYSVRDRGCLYQIMFLSALRNCQDCQRLLYEEGSHCCYKLQNCLLDCSRQRIVKYAAAWISRPFDYRYLMIAWYNNTTTTTATVILWDLTLWYGSATSICSRLSKASSVIMSYHMAIVISTFLN